jgi:salicylate hydroxylase
MMVQSPLHVVIVGGGIGGLFAANALIAGGIAVSVYEQAPAIGEIGAGVFLTPNSVRHLQRIGLEPAVEKWGARVGRESRYFRHDGAPIAPVQVTDTSGWNATFGMHRADLVNMLAEALPPGTVRTGHRCSSFEQDGNAARVSFANGASAEADIVIAADGIHSELRPYVFPPSSPVFHGSVAYRGLVPHERVPHWPTDRWQMWLGQGRHFLTFPVRAGQLINYVGFVPTDEKMKESWSAPGDPDVLRQEFAGWDPRIQELLSEVEVTFRWALYDREPLPVWTRERLSLLGDAAHPMLPHLGQGANQSIEDGMALATILGRADRTTAPLALPVYERLRRERVAQVQRGARENGMRYDSAYSDLGVRDAEITAHAEFRKRLYDYDVVPAAEAAAAALA